MADKWETLIEEHNQFQAPFFCKVKFYAPSRFPEVNAKIQAKNAAHIDYIGTRPGVENIDEETVEAGSMGKNQDEYDLDSDELDRMAPGTAAGHVKYAHERPGSHGLFSGSAERPDVKTIQKELASHEGVVWRVVLSLTEEDAKRLDYTSRKSWETMLRATVPSAAAQMGIGETNLRWVAAFHQEQGHPHVHLVLWEKTPTRRKGKLSEAERKDVRKVFEKEIYAEERNLLFQEKTMTRDLLRDISMNEMTNAVELVREVRNMQKEVELEIASIGAAKVGIPPKLFNHDAGAIAARLNQIGELMPSRGRLAYKFMPAEVKQAVDDTTRWLIRQPAFADSIRRYKAAVEGMTRHFTFKDADIQKAIDKAVIDLEKRVSQVVLKAAAEAKKDVHHRVNEERALSAVALFSQASGKPEDKSTPEILYRTVEALNAVGLDMHELKSVFGAWRARAEMRISDLELSTIIESVSQMQTPMSIEKQYRVAASAMVLAGKGTDDISEILLRAGVQDESVQNVLLAARQLEKESKSFFLNEHEWIKLTRSLGVEAAYPWQVKDSDGFIDERKEAFLAEVRNGVFKAEVDSSERGYSTYCIAVALKTLEVPIAERTEILMNFAAKNGVEDINNIIKNVDKAETSNLKLGTWERIIDNLDKDLKYPWYTEETMVLNKEMCQAANDKIAVSHPDIPTEELKWTIETYAKWLLMENEPDQVKNTLLEWASRMNTPIDSILSDMQALSKRTGDIDVLGKQLKIRDSSQEFINDFTKVLVAAGISSEQVSIIIHDWNQRSGAGMDEARLSRMITAVERTSRDQMAWGRPPVLSRARFQQLTKTLETEAQYIWESTHPAKGRSHGNEPSVNYAKLVWKGAWQAIDQERQRSHAQGELIRRQQERMQQRAADQQREEN